MAPAATSTFKPDEPRKPKPPQQSEATVANDPGAAPYSPQRESKISKVIALFSREEGATLDEMVEVTGWLPHTTRAALTGLKKKGHTIERSKRGEVSCYHVKARA